MCPRKHDFCIVSVKKHSHSDKSWPMQSKAGKVFQAQLVMG